MKNKKVILAAVFLMISILLEITGTLSIKTISQHNAWWSYLSMFLFVGSSFVLFSFAIKVIPLGIGYALWEGLGLLLVTVLSIVIFAEQISLTTAIGLVVMVSGILLVSSGSSDEQK